MGTWRRYERDGYRLGFLRKKDKSGQIIGEQAVVIWNDHEGRHRVRLDAWDEMRARAALDAFVRARQTAGACRIGELYEAYVRDRHRDGKPVKNMVTAWTGLAGWFDGLTPAEITDDLCRGFARSYLDRGRSPATPLSYLRYLRSALRWACNHGLIDRVPYVWLPSDAPPRDRVLTEDEFRRLLEAAQSPHVRLFLLLALCTGHRTTAILELQWDRVDFEAGTIDLRSRKKVDPMSKAYQKGRAVVPMAPLIRAALQTARDARLTDHVIEYGGRPVRTIRQAIRRTANAAGLPDVSAHTLRHTAATLLSEQVSMEETARFLGHADVRTTREVYAKPRPETLQPAAKALNIKVVK